VLTHGVVRAFHLARDAYFHNKVLSRCLRIGGHLVEPPARNTNNLADLHRDHPGPLPDALFSSAPTCDLAYKKIFPSMLACSAAATSTSPVIGLAKAGGSSTS